MSFQALVNQQPAPAVAGDFATTNPRASVVAGPNALVAGPNGCAVGRFGWYDLATLSLVSNTGSGAPNGFIHNSHNALITAYLGETSLVIPSGFMVEMYSEGEFWVVNSSSTEATPGMKAYANNATGVAYFAATGNPPTNGTGTASSIAAATAVSVTGSIAVVTSQLGVSSGVLTVTAVSTGTLVPGAVLGGTGVQSGNTVVAQLTGTTGGVGTYSVSIPQTLASGTITASFGILTVGGTVTGTFAVGDSIPTSGVTAGTYITGLGTGTGGAGTYYVNISQTVSSQSISAASATETGWYCRSFGASGELVKISSRSMG